MSARHWTPPPPAEFAPLSLALRRQAHQQHQAPPVTALEMPATQEGQEDVQVAGKTATPAGQDKGDNGR